VAAPLVFGSDKVGVASLLLLRFLDDMIAGFKINECSSPLLERNRVILKTYGSFQSSEEASNKGIMYVRQLA
jgi:hypothetical protein